MPDLLLTKAPHWEWLAVLYFFVGGLAGGCHALGSLAELFGRGRHRAAANAGFLVAFPAIALGGLILVVDLKRPGRFWHMLFMSERFPTPMLKWWSPMSVGAWFLLVFGGIALVTFLVALASEGRIRAPALLRLREGALWKVLVALGGFFGLCVAGYTGVLLSVTNRPLWAETPWIGAVFTVSAISTSAALLTLLLRRRARDPLRVERDWLARYEGWVVALEAVTLVALALSVGPAIRTWGNATSIVLAVLVVALGILLPLLAWSRGPNERREAWGAALVLVAGFCLRTLVVIPVEMV